jgi:Flp pilus assembly protein protease CpaA
MVFEIVQPIVQMVSITTAFVGTTIAAGFDLKTTEIPDEVPYVMIGIAMALYVAQAFLMGDYLPILQSVFWGLALLGFGYAMYRFGQWGGGDAKLLSAVGFLLPMAPLGIKVETLLPFPLSYSFNLFLVGAAYMIVYALVIALLNRKVFAKFAHDVKDNKKVLAIGSAALFASFMAINYALTSIFEMSFDILFILKNSLLPLAATLGLFVIWKFAKAVEEVGFKKRIPMSKLKVGDVLDDSKIWEGITEKQLARIKKSGKRFIVVKEGVRFAGAFPIALAFTFLAGDGLMLLMRFLF